MTHPGAAKGFLVSIVVLALLPVSALGDDLVFENHTWTKYSSAFTPIVQTTPTALYAFDTTACAERYTGTAEITAPTNVSGTTAGTSFVPDTPIKLRATFKLNYTAAPRNPPTNPAASYRLRIETRESISGTQKCTTSSDVISVNAGANNLTWTADCSIDRFELFNGAHFRTELSITTFNQTGICGYTIYAETSFKTLATSGNVLTGVIKRTHGGKTYWIPDAPIELIDPAGNVIVKTYLRTDPANTAKSWYRLALPADFDFTKQYRLRVVLQSDPDSTLAKLMVFASTTATKPLEILSSPFTLSSTTPNATKDMNLDRASGDIAAATAVTTEAAAEVYWNVWRQLYILRPVVDDRPLTFNLPLEVYLNAPSTFYCITAGMPVCPAASSIVLQPRDSLPGADPSVLWHEFGHYMMAEIHGGQMLPPPFKPEDTQRHQAYHNGFTNSYTTLALDDGFATFWAWISSDILDFDHDPQLYYNQVSADGTRAVRSDGYRSEWNWAIWDVRRAAGGAADQPRGEEFAIAALLWDLYDRTADDEATTRATWTFGGSARTPVDGITISAEQILTLFRSRKPRTLLELYNALKADLAASATSVSGNARNVGLSQLDELFVMQGVFADANGNWAYDYGETIGKGANHAPWSGGNASGEPVDLPARPWRESVPPLANSIVNLTVPGTVPVNVTVSYNFGPGLEKLNMSRQFPVSSGPFYLEMPSPHYPMELIVSFPGSAPIRAQNQAYWLTPRYGALGSYTLSTGTAPVPTITSLSASSAMTGASITINGANFSSSRNNVIVRFGGALGFVTDVSPTRLTAFTPPIAAGSAPVTVEVNGMVSSPTPFSITDSEACRYFVDASGTSFSGSGGVSRIFIYTKPACQWSVTSQASWITLDRPGNHNGNLAVQLTVERNPTTRARSGNVSINGSLLAVTEAAAEDAKRRAAGR